MRTFTCRCGGTLLFQNYKCIACEAHVGVCGECREVHSLTKTNDRFVCDGCRTALQFCENRIQYDVCNGTVRIVAEQSLCRYCSLNTSIPDLSVEGNLDKWKRIEAAKRRVLYDCERIGLPVADDDRPAIEPVLRFEFKASVGEPVSTGHENGTITLNIAEADSVKREQSRVEFGEPQRTLVGHFRHELGHYYFERIVLSDCLDQYRQTFGDERDPTYAESQKRYYAEGPKPDWNNTFISKYATMHSWEDFAETFNAYLDMIAVVGTSTHFKKMRVNVDHRDFNALMQAYGAIGILANELNRDVGLLDLVPEVFSPTVIEKLKFVHRLVKQKTYT